MTINHYEVSCCVNHSHLFLIIPRSHAFLGYFFLTLFSLSVHNNWWTLHAQKTGWFNCGHQSAVFSQKNDFFDFEFRQLLNRFRIYYLPNDRILLKLGSITIEYNFYFSTSFHYNSRTIDIRSCCVNHSHLCFYPHLPSSSTQFFSTKFYLRTYTFFVS